MAEKLNSRERYWKMAKKAKKRVLNQRCTNCGEILQVNGVSAYSKICKICADK